MCDRIVLTTCRAWPELSPSDRCLADALDQRGFQVESAPWNGPFEPFDGARAVVIRSTWDYHQTLDDYRAWLDRLEPTRVFNAPDLVRWTLAKAYLTVLAERGAPLPACTIVEADAALVAGALARLSLREAVIKPTVGASGVGVERVACGREAEALARFHAVTRSPRLLVQEFIPEVTAGEIAGVFFGGTFSHGLRPERSVRAHGGRGQRARARAPPGSGRERPLRGGARPPPPRGLTVGGPETDHRGNVRFPGGTRWR